MISILNLRQPTPPADPVGLLNSLLDLFRVPVLVACADRRLVHANAAGNRLLADGHVLALHGGQIHVAGDACAIVALEDAIRCATPTASETPKPTSLSLTGADGLVHLAKVLPVSGSQYAHGKDGAFAAIFFPATGDSVAEVAGHLQSGLGFTPSEARVAAHVASGLNPRDIAARLNLSVNTIRSHLARIYSKTGCADQTAVCSMINRVVMPVRAPGFNTSGLG